MIFIPSGHFFVFSPLEMWTTTVYIWRATEIFLPQNRQWRQCSRYFRSNLSKYVLVQRSPLVWKAHICEESNCFESFPSKVAGRTKMPCESKPNFHRNLALWDAMIQLWVKLSRCNAFLNAMYCKEDSCFYCNKY